MFIALIKESAASVNSSIREKLKKLKSRVDEDLPLGLRIGGAIEFDSTFKILLDGEFLFSPEGSGKGDYDYLALQGDIPDEMLRVVAFSKFERDGYYWYHFYFNDAEGFLQIITEKSGDIIDKGIKWFSKVGEVIPESPDELDSWTPNPDPEVQEEQDWWIGAPFFHLPEQELDDEGDWCAFAYQRHWGPDDHSQSQPDKIFEYVNLDEFGENTKTFEHSSMLYGRVPTKYIISDEEYPDDVPVEWCYVSYTETEVGDSVDIFIGYTLSNTNFEVIETDY